MTVVVDTSLLVGLLRGHATAAVHLLRDIETRGDPFAIPAVCAQEVLQGARDGRGWRVLEASLRTQTLLHPSGWRTHRSAARIYYDCRRAGITLGSTVDCLIAAQVLESRGTLLHDDADFERIKKVRPLRTLP